MTIRTILVDDEKLAIQGLQLRLEKFPDVEIIDPPEGGFTVLIELPFERREAGFTPATGAGQTAVRPQLAAG